MFFSYTKLKRFKEDKKMKDKKLTEKQRQFAADNHYVLENFLRYRGLPMDEFYDVQIFKSGAAV